MSGGRRAVAIAAGCIAALLVMAATASAEVRIPRGVKVRTDGTLTVGGQDTIYVKHARPKLTLKAEVISAITPRECFNFFDFDCRPQPLFAVPGTPPFRASKKGRASLTFVTPPAWELINENDPISSHPVTFVNGERVFVVVSGYIRKPHSLEQFGLAETLATVEVPAVPSQ